MTLYEVLMAYRYDGYSDPLNLDGQDPKYLTVKINGQYDHIPTDLKKREDHIEEYWEDVPVRSITIQPQQEGALWALKIFTD